jgi:hypothetical protein
MTDIARFLMILGLVLLVAGGLIFLVAKYGPTSIKLPLGQLPGDFRIERGNFTCFFPLVTSIILSIVLTVLLNVIIRFLNR